MKRREKVGGGREREEEGEKKEEGKEEEEWGRERKKETTERNETEGKQTGLRRFMKDPKTGPVTNSARKRASGQARGGIVTTRACRTRAVHPYRLHDPAGTTRTGNPEGPPLKV